MQRLYPYKYYIIVFFLIAFITVISLIFRLELGKNNIVLIHLLPVIVIALRGNFIATTIGTTFLVGILILIYTPPPYNFFVDGLLYTWNFVIFYIIGYIITFQARRIHYTSGKEILYNTLSHDLKTPLSSIMGNATFLVETHPLDPALRYQALSQIIESSRQMNRLISTLLDSARLQNINTPLKKEWCDIVDLIGIALREFRRDVLHERIDCRIDPELQLFYGDSGLLTRLFVNLIDNALKYSHKDKAVHITILPNNNTLRMTFCNECPPVPPNDLEHLFEQFYRAGNTADISGSGVGLSICRDITRAHHGQIKAYNTENGICVEVTLPILKRPSHLLNEVL